MNKVNYGFGEGDTKSTNNPFPVACDVGDVEITGCEYVSGTSQKGNEWEGIKVTYTRKGTSVSDVMFAINPDNVSVRPFIPDDTHQDAVDNAVKIYNTHMLHIATKLGLTSEDLMKEVPTDKGFKAMAEAYCKLILDNCTGVKLYVKTIKDGGYPKISRNSGNTVPFLQCMSDGECTLAYTPKELTTLENAKAPENGVSGGTTTGVRSDWVSRDSI